MASNLFLLVRQGRTAALALMGSAATAGALTAYQRTPEQQQASYSSWVSNLLIPTALADAPGTAPSAPGPKKTTVVLSGFEDVKEVKGFVQTAVAKTLKHQKGSTLQKLVEGKAGATSGVPAPVEPAAFFAFLEKQPLSEKVAILDDVVDAVVREAERSAEVEGLAVGLVGAGAACYALAGWWADLALPGAGTIGCGIAAGVSGHNRAKQASKRTRSRLLNAILESREGSKTPNAFVDYLSATTHDAKTRIASDAKPAAFFNDFYTALKPVLKAAAPAGGDVLETAA